MASRVLLVLLVAVASSQSLAGTIRDVKVNADNMVPIYLQMGQSTVIRFTTKPKKIVVGNQNYFNIEFVGHDLTIQPLGAVKSNLFVYGANDKVYGFTLYAKVSGRYDDLVRAYWKYPKVYELKPVRKKPPKSQKIELDIGLSRFELKFSKVWHEKQRKITIVDGVIFNKGKKQLSVSEIKIHLLRGGKPLSGYQYVAKCEFVEPQRQCEIRIVAKLKEQKAFRIRVSEPGGAFSDGIILSKWL